MSKVEELEELVAEATRVQQAINEASTLMEQPVSMLGQQMTKSIQEKGSYMAAKLAPQFGKAFKSGRPDEAVFTIVCLGGAWLGAYGIDAIRNAHSTAKAKQVLLAYYKELAVKQSMIVEEQQRLIEEICADNALIHQELESKKEKLMKLTQQIVTITELQKNRTV